MTSSTPSTSSQVNQQNILQTLTCPVNFEPLISAVNLFPCNHKINQAVAERLYGKGTAVVQGKPCLICQQIVTAYGPDHAIRSLAEMIFGHTEDLEALPKHPLILDVKSANAPLTLPYPGKSAKFTLNSDHWDTTFVSQGPLNRCLEFFSLTEDSLIKRFSLLGYTDGKIRLSIEFKKKQAFKAFLIAHDLPTEDWLMGNIFYQNPKHIKTMFRILAQHNQFDSTEYQKALAIIERGSCDAVKDQVVRRSIIELFL